MYKFETHCHTAESSSCGQVIAARAIELYLQAGYDGIVITDHFNRENSKGFGMENTSIEDRVNKLSEGYAAAKKAAGDRLAVFFGMEIRFAEDINDYLVYGLDENMICKYPDITEWGIKKFSKFARDNQLLLIQAHPFRNGMSIIDPAFIDMMEIYNGHPRQKSRNEVAQHWSRLHHISGSSGSDFHQEGDEARGGVLLKQYPNSIQDFIVMMKENPLLMIGTN